MNRPERLDFVAVRDAGSPARLIWDPPTAGVTGYVVLTTDNPFPSLMAPEYFAGRMSAFVSEERLGPEAAEIRAATSRGHYCVLAIGADDVWTPVTGLRESVVARGADPALALAFIAATQPRTYNRARWSPRPGPDTESVGVFTMDSAPSPGEVGDILSGAQVPTWTLTAPFGDGFVDTVTEHEFRVHYGAVAVDGRGHRTPLRLSVGGFQRLDDPMYLEPSGRDKTRRLLRAVIDQLEVELRRKSAEREELQTMLSRARDLAPTHPRLDAIDAQIRARFRGR